LRGVVAASPAGAWCIDPERARVGALSLQLPWLVLWLRGASLAVAAWAALAALARQVSWVASVRWTLDAALLGLVASCTGIGPNAAASAACAIVFVR
jgi:hypothetical protein